MTALAGCPAPSGALGAGVRGAEAGGAHCCLLSLPPLHPRRHRGSRGSGLSRPRDGDSRPSGGCGQQEEQGAGGDGRGSGVWRGWRAGQGTPVPLPAPPTCSQAQTGTPGTSLHFPVALGLPYSARSLQQWFLLVETRHHVGAQDTLDNARPLARLQGALSRVLTLGFLRQDSTLCPLQNHTGNVAGVAHILAANPTLMEPLGHAERGQWDLP